MFLCDEPGHTIVVFQKIMPVGITLSGCVQHIVAVTSVYEVAKWHVGVIGENDKERYMVKLSFNLYPHLRNHNRSALRSPRSRIRASSTVC